MRFPAKQYLNHYYKTIGSENDKLMSFYARIKNRIPQNSKHLEIGSGPTIYQIISIAPRISKMIYTDASIGALRHVRKWLYSHEDAFNWDEYVKKALEYENGSTSFSEIENRKKTIRKIEAKLLKKNLSSVDAYIEIGRKHGAFHSISSNFAMEAIVYEKDDFKRLLSEIYKILDKEGVFNIIMVESCKEYQIGDKYLKTLDITKEELLTILINTGFKKEEIISDYEETENEDFGYKGIMFYSCIR